LNLSAPASGRSSTLELIPGFLRACESKSDKAAFILDGKVTSYAQLQRLVDATARDMKVLAKSGDGKSLQHRLHIAVATKNCVDVAVWYLYAAREGHLLCLLDSDWPPETMAHALKLYQPHVLIKQSADHANSSVEMAVTPVTVDERSRPKSSCCDEAVLSDMFFAGFTSGSSGLPKAFVRTAHSWVVSIKAAADEFATDADSVLLAPGPLSHGLSFFALAECFYHGATFVSQSRFSATRCLALISGSSVDQSENKHAVSSQLSVAVTTVILVPSMLHAILERAKLNPAVTSLGRCSTTTAAVRVITAGAKLGVTHSQLFKSIFPSYLRSEYYGASELSFIAVSHAEEEIDSASVGRPFHGVEILIDKSVDSSDAETISQSSSANKGGEDENQGTVLVNSPMIASGYLQRIKGRDGSTLEIKPLSRHKGMATVNDRGCMDAAGHLFLLDREDRMIKNRGFKVYPLTVESVIRDYLNNLFDADEPTEIVVMGMSDDFHGMSVVAIFEAELSRLPEFRDRRAELIEFCQKLLKDCEVPSRYFLTPFIPKTSSGKIAYQQLQLGLRENYQPHLQNCIANRPNDSEPSRPQVKAGFSCSEF